MLVADDVLKAEVSILRHFARGGGFALLTQNLQLYQPSYDAVAMLKYCVHHNYGLSFS